ncbi:protein kinase domain-containing protein [Calidifontibacter terrae]
MKAGDTLGGRYELRTRIAGGGMGEVWSAEDNVLDRTVAVKVIRPELADDADFARRFHHEARLAAKLSHSNIAAVHDFGRDDGVDYLVMEFVRGTSLAGLIDERGALPVDQVVSVITQAAAGLEAAHEAGVVHRDVKPANILITEKGAVKLTDFGIARAMGEAKMTRTGEVMGTAQYLPPEAALGHEVTGQSDLYSLAVVAYEALQGRRPFNADSAVTLAMKHVNEPPPPITVPVPPAVRDAVLHGLAKNPWDRQRGVGNFARELRAGLSHTPRPMPVQPTHGGWAGPVSGPNPGPQSGPTSGPHGYGHPLQPQQMTYGTPYIPMKAPPRVGDRTARTLGWAWIGCCALVLVSFALPWAKLGSQSWTAFQLDTAASYDPSSGGTGAAVFVLIGTLIVAGLGLPQALGRGHIGFSLGALGMSLLTGLIWFAAYAAVDGTTDNPSPLSGGVGLWMCLICGLLTLGVVFSAVFKRR